MSETVEIPDAAVNAVAHVLFDREWVPGDWRWEQYPEPNRWQEDARAALVAARPYLMPTREEIAETLKEAYSAEDTYPVTWEQAADAVLALLNGSEPEPECDCRYGHQPQYTKHEHACSWGRWHLVQQARNGAES